MSVSNRELEDYIVLLKLPVGPSHLYVINCQYQVSIGRWLVQGGTDDFRLLSPAVFARLLVEFVADKRNELVLVAKRLYEKLCSDINNNNNQ
jgi:hypothetical protein